MRGLKYAALKHADGHSGELLEWHDEMEWYVSIARFNSGTVASHLADELNDAEARRKHAEYLAELDAAREADRIVLPNHPDGTPKTADELLVENGFVEPDEPARDSGPIDRAAEPREVQLDALVIPGETKARPELHADHRPDSYGFTDDGRRRDARGRAIGFPGAAPALGFAPNPERIRVEAERIERQRRADVARGIRPAVLIEEPGK